MDKLDEPTMMWMTFPLEVGFEEVRRINLGPHQDDARLREPVT